MAQILIKIENKTLMPDGRWCVVRLAVRKSF